MRVLRTVKLVAVLALIAPCGRLVAQQQAAAPAAPAKTGTAEITGIVVDSIHRRYLAGAEVIIEGVKRTLVTDSAGSFRIGGLPPGTYQVGVFHPLLDTLNISLASRPFQVGPDSVSFLILSVPSAETIIRSACPVPLGGQDHSAVIGHVNDPETLQPIAGAEVSIAWVQIEISKQAGLRRTPHVLRDTTNAAGAFHICGLPSSMQATLQARKGTAATSEVPISLGDADSELLARTLLLSRDASVATAGKATVSGKVVLEGSRANAGSRVELVGTDAVALTNEAGEFTMKNLPSGSRVLLARHLGYAAETVPVDLTAREPQKVTIKLPKYVAIMDPVLVTARRSASLDRVGFNQRKKFGNGYYLGPEQLQQIHANYLTDIFRRVPGLRVQSSGFDDVVTSSRGVGSLSGGDCVQYFVDDMPWMSVSPGDINNFVTGSEVVAVEVYPGPSAPAQYTRGLGGCVTIVLWTRFKIRDLKER
ncbi:MAG: Plug and carboxypeptidase regulatory-like domain-containing protein [Candidatus Dormibacteraeota bacterium]|nr:Plug and carboxypeptidase regulatory-like domain-containing protein [Candidatus Dormibacteraeota bacterium]